MPEKKEQYTNKEKIAQVQVFLPFRKSFDYLLPQNSNLNIASRVLVPFGSRQVVGFISNFSDSTSVSSSKLKSITDILDEAPIINTKLLSLVHKATNYYHSFLGEVFACCLSPAMRKNATSPETFVTLWQITNKGLELKDSDLNRAPKQRQVISYLRQRSSPVELPTIVKAQSQVLNTLVEKGLIESSKAPMSNTLKKLLNISPTKKDICLNKEQLMAIQTISSDIEHFRTSLLFGITGSGKTEVYMGLCEKVINNNKQVLILLPEINLTPQALARYCSRFPDYQLSCWNSSLTDKEKHINWESIRTGKAQLIIGTRSSIWLPYPNLGLIIVDEEHDGSFKQQEGFCYNARDVAVMRAKEEDCPIVLGSATPSLESLHNVLSKKYEIIELKNKANSKSKQEMFILDVRHNKNKSGICQDAIDRIHYTLNKNEQVIIFLNRRGFAPVFYCQVCQWTANCQQCSTKLTFHSKKNKLICHHCLLVKNIPSECPECNEKNMFPVGVGTERMEQEIKSLFPRHNIARLDRDTTSKTKDILENLADGKIDILIGTQMIAKGHDYPNLSLAIIVDIDQSLFTSDYRAIEKLSQQVIQVAGRVGRANTGGEILLQTSWPDHPVLQMLQSLDYSKIASFCLEERKEAILPPYSYQALILSSSKDITKLQSFISNINVILKDIINNTPGTNFLGTITPPIAKLRNRHRRHILLQSNARVDLHTIINKFITTFNDKKWKSSVRWNIDIDPYDFV